MLVKLVYETNFHSNDLPDQIDVVMPTKQTSCVMLIKVHKIVADMYVKNKRL